MSKKRILILVGIILAGSLLLFLVLGFWMVSSLATVPLADSGGIYIETLKDRGKGKGKDKVAQIDVEGVIMSGVVDDFKKMLKKAVKDDRVKSILVRVDSPGGAVTASDVMYDALKNAAEKKPVVIFMDNVAASGGYYIACAGDHVICNETGITGSIGVIIQTYNYVDLFDKVGLKSAAFTSGDFKDTMSGSRPMREDEREYVQKLVSSMYEKFVGIVSEAREIPVEKLKDGIADGRIFTGAEAKEVGLVDEVGYIEAAYAKARELGKSPNASIYRYGKQPGIAELIGIMKTPQKLEIDVSERLLPRLEAGIPYMLPSHYVR